MFNLVFDFLHSFKPQPIFLRLGFFAFHWYSFLIVLALILGYLLVVKLARAKNIKKELLEDLFLNLIIFGFIGARLYYVFSELPYYLKNPLEIFAVWRGGLGIFGAVIGGLIVLFFFARKNKLNFWVLTDLLAPALILGQAIGRWGNYFNQEVFGRPTNLPWGIPIDSQLRPREFLTAEYFHPTFLYESLWNFLIFLGLIFLGKYLIKLKPGRIFAFYLIFYSLGRFFIEFIRIDFQPLLFGLRLGQVFAGLAFLIGIIILLRRSPGFK
jgi:phosphatidylglycerol:prolipoprotein diacylglycerol transferase